MTSDPVHGSSAAVGTSLTSDPVAAESRARQALQGQPNSADALLVLSSALRQQGRAQEAEHILRQVLANEPDSAFGQLELGLTLQQLGKEGPALDALARAVDLSPTYLEGWCAVAGALARSEIVVHTDARDALERALDCMQGRRFPEAERLLANAITVAPDFLPARLALAVSLLAQGRAHLAVPAIGELVRRDPEQTLYRELSASALLEMGEFHRAIAEYERLLGDARERPGAWVSYGRALQAIGRADESLQAFRTAVRLLPQFAAGYRTLATVKTTKMDAASVDTLRGLLGHPGLLVLRRAQLHFALAKALEDTGQHAEAFEQYQRSNELQAARSPGNVDLFLDLVRRTKALFTPAFLRERAGAGLETHGPIFVVGMLRAGSTLVQEILVAHSSVERLGELRVLNDMAIQLSVTDAAKRGVRRYPEGVALLDRDRFRQLGEEYLERTRPRRKSGLPLFVDKLPENFIYTALIALILPNAKIIDVRRHPLDCCFSCFTNYFPEGPGWSHSLDDLGRYYAGYVELMAHFEAIMPGRIHRVFYEKLVDDPEKEVRRLLDYLGLPFEEECLRFYAREQEIVTTSADQARLPIYRNGVGTSRNFDVFLLPLKRALGQVLESYPQVPNFYPRLHASFSLRLS